MLDHKGFDLWADGYDRDVQLSEESDEYPFAGYKDVLNTVYGIVRKKIGTLLDIGFGTGVLTQKLYQDGYRITGIDFSERMIEIAQKKMPTANLIQYNFVEGLPNLLEGEKFDWIISTYAIHHLTDEEKKMLINSLLTYLKPKGSIVLGDVAFPSRKELEAARQRDLEIWDDEEFYPVADEMAKMFPDLKIFFSKIAYCSGVVEIKR